jgi:hypothetical protein
MHTDIHAFSGNQTHDPSVQRVKTVHALDRAATVFGLFNTTQLKYKSWYLLVNASLPGKCINLVLV